MSEGKNKLVSRKASMKGAKRKSLSKKLADTITKQVHNKNSIKNMKKVDEENKKIDQSKAILYLDVLKINQVEKKYIYVKVLFNGKSYNSKVVSSEIFKHVLEQRFLFKANNNRDNTDLTIEIYTKKVLRKKPSLQATIVIKFEDLYDEKVRHKWFPLDKVKKSKNGYRGSAYLKVQYCETEIGKMNLLSDIIPPYTYDSLEEIFCQVLPQTFAILFDNTYNVPSSKTILQIIIIMVNVKEMKSREIVQFIVENEVNQTETVLTLFRSNSLSSKMVTAVTQYFGGSFLKDNLSALVQEIIKNDEDLEVEPFKLQGKPGLDAKQNMKKLLAYAERLLTIIITSIDSVAEEIRQIAFILGSCIEKKFDKGCIKISTASLFFLRFINPALITPNSFGLCENRPTKTARRTFVLITKIVQGVANGVKFGDKELFMKPANKLMDDMLGKIDHFLLKLPKEGGGSKKLRSLKDEVSQKNMLSLSDQDREILWALYTVHGYLYGKGIADVLKSLQDKNDKNLALPNCLNTLKKKKVVQEVFKIEDVLNKLGAAHKAEVDIEVYNNATNDKGKK